MSLAEVEDQLRQGACFVFYEYCISLMVITLRRPSAIYLLPPPTERLTQHVLIKLAFLSGAFLLALAGWVYYVYDPISEVFYATLLPTTWLLVTLAWWMYKTWDDARWPDETGLKRGFVFSLVSFLFGWWGLPWGIIYTPMTIFTNLCGGQDVTDEVWELLQSMDG